MTRDSNVLILATMEQGNLAKGQNGGAASLASGLCLGKYEVLAFYRLGVANAASRRREGRLRPPVVYNAGHQGKNYGHQWDDI